MLNTLVTTTLNAYSNLVITDFKNYKKVLIYYKLLQL
jgi:hypothetical protein